LAQKVYILLYEWHFCRKLFLQNSLNRCQKSAVLNILPTISVHMVRLHKTKNKKFLSVTTSIRRICVINRFRICE